MITRLVKKVFGTRNDRILKRLNKSILDINKLEEKFTAFEDKRFPIQTALFRERLDKGENISDLLPEAFALVREASKRALGMRHFDVQLMGGMVLNEGNIAEMRTGEGKTLVATLAAYLNALEGNGVHVITVNDYLARRDAEWMGKIYSFLGMKTGVIIAGMKNDERREAYNAEITYGTNNEFGFDYLRDNLAFNKSERVQRALNFAIVDEVDSILIDEARTPLIISGAVDDRSDLYISINRIIPALKKQESEDGPGDYSVDEKNRQAYLTEEGNDRVEKLLQDEGIIEQGRSLYDATNLPVVHHLNAALRAHTVFNRDVDYIIKDNEIVIVDEFTGRTMAGRRWSEGLHQAIEAKEGVPIQNENQTLASITYQNFFRLYKKISGMTGTADTEAYEFQQIYGLEVIVIPTHMQMVREDFSDAVYLKAKDKFNAIINDIISCRENDRPVLVGTASIEVSEYISDLLKKKKIPHQVLNAKFHEREAEIIAQAGRPGTVTIATNMAGRGTDIVLGGNLDAELAEISGQDSEKTNDIRSKWKERHDYVVKCGGLHITGTERHESRRIDNQLRGRAGRQGDPGSSRFYLSLEDSLMRIFASDKITSIMQKLGMEDSEAIESIMVSRAIENAQRKVEAHNFDIRKHLLEFDDVANDQRKVIYQLRNDLLDEDDISETIINMRVEVLTDLISSYIPPGSIDEMWNIQGLMDVLSHEFSLDIKIQKWLDDDLTIQEDEIISRILETFSSVMNEKEQIISADIMRRLEKQVMLDILDREWKEHLVVMDQLRQGINLRSYASKNPKQEYKKDSFQLFLNLLDHIKHEVIRFLIRVQVRSDDDLNLSENKHARSKNMQYSHPAAPNALGNNDESENKAPEPFVRGQRKIGRNEACPCGSGKKYKHCHGKLN